MSTHHDFQDSTEALLFLEQAADQEREAKMGKAFADVMRGRALLKVRDTHPFGPDSPYRSFIAWAEKRVGYGQVQRDRLLAAGRLDPELVVHQKISLQKLAALGSQPEWLHATLVGLQKNTPEARLTRAGNSARKHLELHDDVDAALAHARLVVKDATQSLVEESRLDSEETLLKRLESALKRSQEASYKLLARTGGQPLSADSPEALRLAAALLPAEQTLAQLRQAAHLSVSPIGLTPEAPAGPRAYHRAYDRHEEAVTDDEEVIAVEEADIVSEEDTAAAAAPEPAAEPTPPPPYEPPQRPYADPQGEALLPVYGHGSVVPQATPAERLSYRVLALMVSLSGLGKEFLRRRWDEHESSVFELHRQVFEQLHEARGVLALLIPLLQPAIDSAKASELPDVDEPVDTLLDWVLHDNGDPLHIEDPTESDRILWTMLGQLPLFTQALDELKVLRQQGGDDAGIDQRVLSRLGELLGPLRHLLVKLTVNLAKGAGFAIQEREARLVEQAEDEALRGPRESRIILVGADELPPAHAIFARTAQGHLATWNLWEPMLSLLMGDRGKGKSHLIRILVESMTLRPAGLAFLRQPQCPILIDSDCTQGEGRFQMLEGFFPNRNAAQLAALHQYYQTDARNLAFKRGFLLCHQDQVGHYRRILAPYIERGLVVMPLKLGIPDLGSFAFEVMLQWAVGGNQHAVYKNLIQTVVAKRGERLTLQDLRDAVEKSSLRGTPKQMVMEFFDLLEGFYSEGESVMQYVRHDPVFTVVRGRYLPNNFVNPLQAVVFNAFCRSAAHGDPPRLVIFEELAKMLNGNPVMLRFLMNFAAELRHRPVGAMGCLVNLEHFPKGLWAAADTHMIFGLSNPRDWKKAGAEHQGMRRTPFAAVETHALGLGQVRAYARRSNVPDLASGLLLDIRPTLIRAGGETMNAGDDWGA